MRSAYTFLKWKENLSPLAVHLYDAGKRGCWQHPEALGTAIQTQHPCRRQWSIWCTAPASRSFWGPLRSASTASRCWGLSGAAPFLTRSGSPAAGPALLWAQASLTGHSVQGSWEGLWWSACGTRDFQAVVLKCALTWSVPLPSAPECAGSPAQMGGDTASYSVSNNTVGYKL